ncbi:MAG: aminopeptidase [Nanobdellota archaeon]
MGIVDPQRYIRWLKEQNLYQKAFENHESFKPVFSDLMKIKRRDELLIVGDLGLDGKKSAPLMTGCYVLCAKRMGLSYKLVLQNPKKTKDSADQGVVGAFDRLQEDSFLVIALSGKLGSMRRLGKSFRKLAQHKRWRFVSTPRLSELATTRFSSLVDAINIDYRALQVEARRLERTLTGGNEVRIYTTAGTSLKMKITGMQAVANDGRNYDRFGGNIPLGEVYLPPRTDHVEGKIVIDGSLRTRYGTHLLQNPVTLYVEKGSITKITGNTEGVRKLRETLEWAEKKSKFHWGVRRIGELGIGINPKASIVGPTIVNEKARNTAHVAIGSNAWFGGSIYSIIHLDQVFRDPRIIVDGKRIR